VAYVVVSRYFWVGFGKGELHDLLLAEVWRFDLTLVRDARYSLHHHWPCLHFV
jgi:hypothetical protein